MNLNKLTIALAAAFSLTAGISQTALASNAQAASATSAASAQLPTSITDIRQMQQDGKTVVRIGLDAPLSSMPRVFSVGTPPRMAFDLPANLQIVGPKVRQFESGLARSLSVVQDGQKTRVVLNLRGGAAQEMSTDGNALILTLSDATAAAESASPVKRFAEGDMSTQHSITAFDFRRGPSGEGRVIVDLSDTSAGIDIRQQGRSLVVNFMGTSAAANLLNKMNVTDFGTLVQDVALSSAGSNTRMVVNPTGDWEYNAYQADKRFVVEVRPRGAKNAESKAGDGKADGVYAGEKMSLNFQNVDVRNLLNVIADFTKLNIVAADTVKGNLTVRLQDVPWDQALDLVLTTRGLDMRRKGSVIWVAPREEIAAQEKASLEAKTQIAELESTRTESFLLNYSKASDVALLLNNKQQPILSKRGSVVIDPRTNQLFVQDIPSRLEEVQRIIKKVDIPVRQVQIEARIVEASDSFSRNLGARLGFFTTGLTKVLPGVRAGLGSMAVPPAASPPEGAFVNTPSVTGGTAPISLQNMMPQVNLPAQPLGSGATPASFALTLLNGAASNVLSLELSAAEADGRGKIVSSPRVITANQEKALIEQGTELPYQQASSSGATNVAFKKANLKLEVTPQITPDGNVIMEVDINKDAPGANTAAGFAIDTKHIQTKVLIENGGTVVIGGIYTQDERNDVDKVPFFGDLPGVGNLFRSTVKRDNKTELLIFLTPRILDGGVTAKK